MLFFFYLFLTSSVHVEVDEIDKNDLYIYFTVGMIIWFVITIFAFYLECFRQCLCKSKENTTSSSLHQNAGGLERIAIENENN